MSKKKLTRLEKAEKYQCDGLCYGGLDANGDEVPCCPCIDTCEETRYGEFWATVVVFLLIVVLPACIGIGLLVLAVNFVIQLFM